MKKEGGLMEEVVAMVTNLQKERVWVNEKRVSGEVAWSFVFCCCSC